MGRFSLHHCTVGLRALHGARPGRAALVALLTTLLSAPPVWAQPPVAKAKPAPSPKAAPTRAETLRRAEAWAGVPAREAKAKALKAQAQTLRQRQEGQRLQRALSKGKAVKLGDAALKAALVKESPALGPAVARARLKPLPEVQATPRPPKQRLPGFKPPAPRQRFNETGAITRDAEALYASVAGEEAFVLEADGSLSPADVSRPAAKQLAGLLGDLMPLPLTGALPDPTAADVAETAEARFTPDLVALAAANGNDALKLYNLVHAQVAPALYYGSKKGAQATWRSKSGNDFDTASLLIALLRLSNIPARYEYGTVRLSLAQAQALTGASTAQDAAYQLSQAGVPAGVGTGGTSVLMERAWVRAYVPYEDYRGTGSRTGAAVWVRLDPGMKVTQWPEAVDLRGLASFDADAYLSTLNPKTPLEVYEGQLLLAARAKNLCNTLATVSYAPVLAQPALRLLPADHPAKVESSLLVFDRPPATFRWEAQLDVGGATHVSTLAELQYRKVALTWVGATAGDEAALQAAGDIVNVVPYRVRVKPVLKVDGAEVSRGADVFPGQAQALSVRVTMPGGSPVAVTHRVVAGSAYALALTAGPQDATWGNGLSAEIPEGQSLAATEAAAHAVAWTYAHHQEEAAQRLTSLTRHGLVEDVLEVLAGRELSATQAFGLPVALTWGLYFIDVRRDSLTPVPRDGKAGQVANFVQLLSSHGSVLEAKVWEEVFANTSVSAVRLLQAASSQGVTVHRLSPGQSLSVLTGYSQTSLDDMQQALDAGWRVTAPARPVTYAQYADVEAYLLLNPVTGAGANKLGLLLNGGGSGGPGSPSADECPTCAGKDVPGSRINMSTGNLRESWTDLTLPATGLPIVFGRTYASRSPRLTELGFGWVHTYGVRLFIEPNGDVTFLADDLREVRFVKTGTAYTAPAGWHDVLTAQTFGYRLTDKYGGQQDFDSQGRLVAMRDTSGNSTTLVYGADGLLAEVRDADGRTALTFGYGGGKVTTVTDRTGRVVRFRHTGDDLTGCTDVLGQQEAYDYDARHNLISRLDASGATRLDYYDALDRWVGGKDGLGNEKAAVYDTEAKQTVYFDRTGQPWRFSFNAGGAVTSEEGPAGTTLAYTLDADFNRLSSTDGRGLSTTNTFDTKGNLLTRTLPDARVETYTYNALSRPLTEAATGLPTVTNTYNAAGMQLTRADGLGTTSFGYDARGQLTTQTQPGSAVTTIAHNPDGTIAMLTDPTGKPTTLAYDSFGHAITFTDGAGNARRMDYDVAGRVTASEDALGNRTVFGLDALGRRTSTTDAAGKVTTYTLDAEGRVTAVADALGRSARTTYDAEGRVLSTTDALGRTTTRTYDAEGRLVQTKDATGATTGLVYCADVSTPCAEVDALGHLTTRSFDATGRLLSTTDALGREASTTYDTAGRPLSQAGPLQPATQNAYSTVTGLLTSVANGILTTAFTYDARGNRLRVTAQPTTGSGTAETTTYTYDVANRLLTERTPHGKTTAFTYDAAGRRETKLDAKGLTTTYQYDAAGRLLHVVFASGAAYDYTYDALGRRTSEKSPTHERRFQYDAVGQVVHVDDVTLGATLDATYDANGQRTSVTASGVGRRYGYDTRGLLQTAALGQAGLMRFGYDAAGRRRFVTRPNGVRTEYVYDDGGQLLGVTHTKGGAVLASYAYQYDAQGLRTQRAEASGRTEAYGYDAAHRLRVVDEGTATTTYTLDYAGNRTAETKTGVAGRSATYNTFNQQLVRSGGGEASVSLVWDDNGNLLRETQAGAVTSYVWDEDNRLRQVTTPTSGVTDYEYDANGLRVLRSDAKGTVRYLLDGMEVLEEVGSGGAVSVAWLNSPQAIDESLAFETGGATYYPLLDALNSVMAITDASGQVVREYQYDVYGARISSTGSGPDVDRGHAGRYHDANGLIEHRDRQRNPLTGNWLQADRIGIVAGPNAYLAISAKPTRAVDPTGFYVTNSFDALLMTHPLVWLAVAVDIGIMSAAGVGDAFVAYVRPDIALHTILPKCTNLQDTQPERVLYRGLSSVDVREWGRWGVVNSKYVRGGNPDSDAISHLQYELAVRKANWKSVDSHMKDTSYNSPWVSVTSMEGVANQFAKTAWPGEDPPGHKVMRLRTRRMTVPSTFGGKQSIKEGEELLFLRIGIPMVDYVEAVYDAYQ